MIDHEKTFIRDARPMKGGNILVEGTLNFALSFWNFIFNLIGQLLGISPQEFGKDGVWQVISNINGSLMAVGLALLPVFFMIGMVKAGASYVEYKRPEAIGKVFVRFGISWAVVVFGMDLLMYIWGMCQSVIQKIITNSSGGSELTIPQELHQALSHANWFDSILLWILAAIGTIVIMVLSIIVILSVFGRFFRIYLYLALAPIPMASFAGEPTQSTGISFIKGFAAHCLEGAIIVLACIIFSLFSGTSIFGIDTSNVWSATLSYLGSTILNMMILVTITKMADRVTREMLGL